MQFIQRIMFPFKYISARTAALATGVPRRSRRRRELCCCVAGATPVAISTPARFAAAITSRCALPLTQHRPPSTAATHRRAYTPKSSLWLENMTHLSLSKHMVTSCPVQVASIQLLDHGLLEFSPVLSQRRSSIVPQNKALSHSPQDA